MIDHGEGRSALVIFSFDASVKAFAGRMNAHSSAERDLRGSYERTLASVLDWRDIPAERRLAGMWEGEIEASYLLTLVEFKKALAADRLITSLVAAETCVLQLFPSEPHGRYYASYVSYQGNVEGRYIGKPRLVFGSVSREIAERESAWTRNATGDYFIVKPAEWWRGVAAGEGNASLRTHGERVAARRSANSPW